MNPVVIVVVIVLITAVFVIRRLPEIYSMKSIAEKPFACPNCGNHFHVKWYRLIFREYSVYTSNSAKLKCPGCGKVDFCRWKG